MLQSLRRPLHCCTCEVCQQEPHSALAEDHRSINRLVATLDEKRRRQLVGLLATQQGRGGIERLARITSLSPKTIRRGQREIEQPATAPSQRIRRPGAGRKRLEKKTWA